MPFKVPESWEWQKLGDIGVWQSGATPSRLNKDYYGGNIPWLKTGDLNDGYIHEIPETITQKALEETSRSFGCEKNIISDCKSLYSIRSDYKSERTGDKKRAAA